MTDTATAYKNEKKFFWVLGAVGAAIALLVLAYAIGTDVELDVRVTSGNFINITNVGSTPLTIRKISINERRECLAGSFMEQLARMEGHSEFRDKNNSLPRKLQVGDDMQVGSDCTVVRITFDTDLGSATYTFDQR
jgi:hypothetical protein